MIAKRLGLVSIPFGAIVHEAIRVEAASGQAMLLVRFSRRSRDGSYANEEIEAVREEQASRLVTSALECGEGGFWGGWFGLHEPTWLTPTPFPESDTHGLTALVGRNSRRLAKIV